MGGKTVTRASLSRAVQEAAMIRHHVSCPPGLARHLVEETLRHIADALVAGEDVKISTFGTFRVRDKAERTGRNPQTGETALITPRHIVNFRPSEETKIRVQRGNRDG